MKKYFVFLVFAWALASSAPSAAQQKAPLRLLQTVSVPGAARKWDHFGVDLQGHRLFATSENEPAVEVFDLRTNASTYALSPISRSRTMSSPFQS